MTEKNTKKKKRKSLESSGKIKITKEKPEKKRKKERVKNEKAPTRVFETPAFIAAFAQPLASAELQTLLFKLIKKATKEKLICRGVKEVVKTVQKIKANSDSTKERFCILAGDITPIDVITHVPVLLEESAIPYIYVGSRAELGAASLSKRPTSIIMVQRTPDCGFRKSFKSLKEQVQSLKQ